MGSVVGIGVDVVSVSRIREALDRTGERFTRRVFSEGERSFCERQADPAEHYAVRWAAKEAVFKSIPDYPEMTIPWRKIDVERRERGNPVIRIPRENQDELGLRFHLSLSHAEDTAIAFVVAETEDGNE